LQQYQGYPPSSKTNLQSFFANFGIHYTNDMIIGNTANPEKISIDIDGVVQSKTYPIWFFASNEDFLSLHFRTSGKIDLFDNEGIKTKSLISTTAQSGEIAYSQLRYMPKSKVINLYKNTDLSYNLAVLAEGEFQSGFIQNILENSEYKEKIPPFRLFSKERPKLALVADSDFISDDTWVLESKSDNPVYSVIPYASNADFTLNLIDEMLGGRELIRYSNLTLQEEKANITKEIYSYFYAKSIQQLEDAERKVVKSAGELRDLRQRAVFADQGDMLEYNKLLHLKEEENQEDQQNVKYIKHIINSSADDKINIFVIMNLVAYPLILILAMLSIMCLARKINMSKYGGR
jgi:ABC-type uncharacterized transport system involved in gliding motility auxiliary subunit